MPFYKQPGFILNDSLGNLHNFVWDNGNIILTSFERSIGKSEKKVLISNATVEFDVTITSEDKVYILWKSNDGSINLTSNKNGTWKNVTLIKVNSYKILNLNIKAINEEIHIFYCVASNEDENNYRIQHHFQREDNWVTNEVEQIRTSGVLNPVVILKNKEDLILAYNDLDRETEEIFIKSFNSESGTWNNSTKLTSSGKRKLYLDMIIRNDDIHITYCEYDEGNYVVKYGKYRFNDESIEKIVEIKVSNPANCSYPILIYYEGKLWIAWNEFNYLASRYSTDLGENWEALYMWKISRKVNYLRYKHMTNGEFTNDYLLNYSFARTDNLSFIGFGDLENTEEIPIKKKEGDIGMVRTDGIDIKDETLVNESKNNANQFNNEIERLNEEIIKIVDNLESRISEIDELRVKIDSLERKIDGLKDLKDVRDRTENIENYLLKKSRSFRKL